MQLKKKKKIEAKTNYRNKFNETKLRNTIYNDF